MISLINALPNLQGGWETHEWSYMGKHFIIDKETSKEKASQSESTMLMAWILED